MSRWQLRATRWSVGAASALVLAAAFIVPDPVAAECTRLDPWPSFMEAARSATTIIIGDVVESLADDSAGNAVWFRLRVDEVLRGSANQMIELKYLFSGVPIKVCDESILRVRMKDRIAFAFDARIQGLEGPVTAIAWVREGVAPTPSPAPGSANEHIESVRDFLVPGVERLAASEVRALAAMPATDTKEVQADRPPAAPWPVIAVLAAAGLGGLALLNRPRRRREHRGR